jgi:hypothetical protein
MRRGFLVVLLAAALASGTAANLFAAPYDTPSALLVSVGVDRLHLTVTAGPSGAPNGFSMYWMTQTDYDNYGDVWPSVLTYPTLHWANFTGVPTLNTGLGLYTSYALGPNQSIEIDLGDLFDETGLTTNSLDPVDPSTDYQICAFANGGGAFSRSAYSPNTAGRSDDDRHCRHSHGYWKGHGGDWPCSSLKLGNVTYTQSQLMQILNLPANGNGLVSLAHELIASKLNVTGGSYSAPILSWISTSDAHIGNLVVPPIGNGSLSPASTEDECHHHGDYNEGHDPHDCNPTPAATQTWGRIKSLYR